MYAPQIIPFSVTSRGVFSCKSSQISVAFDFWGCVDQLSREKMQGGKILSRLLIPWRKPVYGILPMSTKAHIWSAVNGEAVCLHPLNDITHVPHEAPWGVFDRVAAAHAFHGYDLLKARIRALSRSSGTLLSVRIFCLSQNSQHPRSPQKKLWQTGRRTTWCWSNDTRLSGRKVVMCFEGSEAWFHPARTGNRYSSLIVLVVFLIFAIIQNMAVLGVAAPWCRCVCSTYLVF